MVDMSGFRKEDGSPVYLQIIKYIERGIASGRILSGDELPPRRVLAALLGINPNTVQRAYKELEDGGLIASSQGAKSVVRAEAAAVAAVRERLTEDAVRESVKSLRSMGLTKNDALSLIEKFWEEEA